MKQDKINNQAAERNGRWLPHSTLLRWVVMGGLLLTGFGLIAQDPIPAKDPASAISGFAEVQATNPVGAILAFPAEAAPVGYLLCDGRSVSTTDYPALYAVLGNTYGGDAANFTLPDYRGYFLRGWSAADTLSDPDRDARSDRGDGTAGNSIGTRQDDEFERHRHGYWDSYYATSFSGSRIYGTVLGSNDGGDVDNGVHGANTNTDSTGFGTETRPLNTYVAYYIKATDHEVIAGNLAIGSNIRDLNERLRVQGDANLLGNLSLTGDFIFPSAARLDIKPTEAAAAALSITDQGKVGIGTINPTARFTVNGDIAAGDLLVDDIRADTIHTKGLSVQGMIVAEEFEITMDTWPDYVFEKGYPLPTLEEVEHHITEKGHLQDIPARAEVLENGINIGEMNAKLLQKIE